MYGHLFIHEFPVRGQAALRHQLRLVGNDHHIVLGHIHIHFQDINAHAQGFVKSRQGVLRAGAARTAVPVNQGEFYIRRMGQSKGREKRKEKYRFHIILQKNRRIYNMKLSPA